MKINQLKAGVILSYGTQGVHILTALIYTPVMLRLLGQSEYGLYQLVYSVVHYLGLLSMGFGSGYMRFFARYKAEENKAEIAKLNGIFLLIFSAVSFLCVVLGGVMVWKADAIFGTGLTAAELGKARVLMTIMVINMVVTFMNSVFSGYVTAHEKFFFQRVLTFLQAVCSPFITLPLLLLGFGSVAMVSVTLFLCVFVLLMNIYFCFKKLSMQFSFSNLKLSILREMWAFTFFIFLNMIVDQINWSVDRFLLGRMLGTAAVAVYGVAGQLNTLYLSLSTAVSGVFIPKVNFNVAKEKDMKNVTALFNRVGRIQFIIAGLIASGYVLYGRDFIRIWAGEGYGEAYVVGLFLLLPVTVPVIQNLGIEIQRAQNKHRTRSVVYLLIAVSNIFLSIPLIKIWGAVGAAAGTMLSLLFGNGLFMNWYYHKRIGLDILSFWKEIGKLILPICLSVICALLLKQILPTKSIGGLATAICIYLILYLGFMWIWGLNASEKDLFRKPLKKLGGKLCRKS